MRLGGADALSCGGKEWDKTAEGFLPGKDPKDQTPSRGHSLLGNIIFRCVTFVYVEFV